MLADRDSESLVSRASKSMEIAVRPWMKWAGNDPVLLVMASVFAVVVLLLFVGTWYRVQSDRRELTAQFAAESDRELVNLAASTAEDISDIADDLRFVATLLREHPAPAEQRRSLETLIDSLDGGRAAALVDAEGRPLEVVQSQQAAPVDVETFFAGVPTTPITSRDAPAPVDVSAVVDTPNGAFRTFTVPVTPGVTALTVVANADAVLDPLVVDRSDSRILVVGPHGLITPATSVELREPKAQETLRPLLEHMRSRRTGRMRIDAETAKTLGLGPAEVVVSYRPVDVEGVRPWSLATFRSMAVLRSVEQRIITRMVFVWSAIALLIVAFAGYIVVSIRRRTVLQERLSTARKVAELNEMADAILDNIPTGVLLLSDARTIVDVNTAMVELFQKNVIGRDLVDAFADTEADRLATLIETAHMTGERETLVIEGAPLFGRPGFYAVHALPLHHGSRETAMMLVFEDFTEIRSLEAQLLNAEKLSTIGVLAAGIAHEVGTPLGVIRGRAEYAMRKLDEGSPETQSLQVIVDQIDRVSRVIQELLDFSRARPASTLPVPLDEVVHKVLDLLQFEFERTNVTVSIDVPSNLPPLAAEPDRLQQVMINLIVNAADACAEGGRVAIRASQSPEEHAVAIEIEDNGCGIPSEHIHQVFDPFFTTKKRGQGTGLGLAVVSQIVRSHGGRIELVSEPDEGTRVTLYWPVDRSTKRTANHAA